MEYCIIVSKKDIAGMNIFDCLVSEFEFLKTEDKILGNSVYSRGRVSLIQSDEDSLFSGELAEQVDADTIIFATRHQSAEKKPCLSCHVPGNWSSADYGGEEGKVCIAPGSLLKEFYLRLKANNNLDGFETTLECTHHGPLITKPCIFVEIGSCEDDWKRKDAGMIIAKTISDVLFLDVPEYKVVFGVGGPHYCNNFNKLNERTEYAVGHVCPKYMIGKFSAELLSEALEKNLEKVELIAIDWKGLGADKDKVMSLIESSGIKYDRIKNLLK